MAGSGNFALGNPTGNVVFDGTSITLNGQVVASGNLQANSVIATNFAAGSVTADRLVIDNFNVINTNEIAKVGSIYGSQVVGPPDSATYSANIVSASSIGDSSQLGLFGWSSVPNTTSTLNSVSVTMLFRNPFPATTIFPELQLRVGSYSTFTSSYSGNSATFRPTISPNAAVTNTFTLTFSRITDPPTSMRIYINDAAFTSVSKFFNGAISVQFLSVTPAPSPNPFTKTIVALPAINTYP